MRSVGCVGLGVALCAAAALQGHPWEGLLPLLALLLLGVSGALTGRSRRRTGSDVQASAWTGVAVTLAALIGVTYEIAQGRDGWPYSALLLLGAAVYVVSSRLTADR